jgi:hypothetical protein
MAMSCIGGIARMNGTADALFHWNAISLGRRIASWFWADAWKEGAPVQGFQACG